MDINVLAKYVINYCIEMGSPISNLQLQKILYFIEGEYFKQKGKWFTGAEFYAWPFGPVNKEVYKEYCVYGGGLIFEKADVQMSNDDRDIVNPIIDKYATMSITKLVNFAHKDGGAWKLSYDGNRDTKINKLYIQNEFK